MSRQYVGSVAILGQAAQRMQAVIPEGHTPEDVISQTYWLPVRGSLRAGDVIEAEPIDASWRMELRVMGVEEQGLRVLVAPLHFWRFPAQVALPEGYDLVFEGTSWRIYRHKQPLRGGFASEIDAAFWLLSDRGLDVPQSRVPAPTNAVSEHLTIGYAPKTSRYFVRGANNRPVDDLRFELRAEAEEHLQALRAAAA